MMNVSWMTMKKVYRYRIHVSSVGAFTNDSVSLPNTCILAMGLLGGDNFAMMAMPMPMRVGYQPNM